jgi:large subunit ribosomal protein L24
MQRVSVGDIVEVISGNDKGKRGKVTRLLKDRGAVVVEGIRRVKRHLRATPQRGGGILEIEAPIALSKVMPIDPTSDKPTRVSFKKKAKGKGKVRIGKSGAEIPEQRE